MFSAVLSIDRLLVSQNISLPFEIEISDNFNNPLLQSTHNPLDSITTEIIQFDFYSPNFDLIFCLTTANETIWISTDSMADMHSIVLICVSYVMQLDN